jgi:hypothetical protein
LFHFFFAAPSGHSGDVKHHLLGLGHGLLLCRLNKLADEF